MSTKKRGAPRRKFHQPTADRICELLMDGRSLAQICAMKAMPSKQTVRKWQQENPQFATDYARARAESGHTFMDYIVELMGKANERNYNSIRVKVDALKWICAKMLPRIYGDRLELQGGLELTDMRQGPMDKPLAAWTREEKLDWMRRQVYLVASIGQQMRDLWGLEGLASGFGYLGDQTWKQLLAVIDGRGAPSAPNGLLPAPPPDAPKPLESEPDGTRREVEINPRRRDTPLALPHYPSRDEMGLK